PSSGAWVCDVDGSTKESHGPGPAIPTLRHRAVGPIRVAEAPPAVVTELDDPGAAVLRYVRTDRVIEEPRGPTADRVVHLVRVTTAAAGAPAAVERGRHLADLFTTFRRLVVGGDGVIDVVGGGCTGHA